MAEESASSCLAILVWFSQSLPFIYLLTGVGLNLAASKFCTIQLTSTESPRRAQLVCLHVLCDAVESPGMKKTYRGMKKWDFFGSSEVWGVGWRTVRGCVSMESTKWLPIWSVFRISPVSNLHKWPTQGGPTIKNSWRWKRGRWAPSKQQVNYVTELTDGKLMLSNRNKYIKLRSTMTRLLSCTWSL